MNDRALIRTGTAGATVAAICCAMPVLAVLLPLVGLSAWMARADLVLFPLLAASLGLIAWGVYRRRTRAACCETRITKKA
ncbi:mercuric ion transport protein [Hephaestia caeni]|jgi:mercuric ion transport protein|uniref:Mercuric ion transport protein n=1 Tax=Hephaestia caeni TaxID=645617 RepID=A0A397NH17_9SPHN|nr:mercury resistance system transport protein MerF [Hephaestia caeni]KOX56227.1 mercury transport protein [Streptomyces purpurogeneiscleroticus]ODT74231.1 MAG: mercury transport protein [Pelagibacterium sp. SCN 64-44]RIA36822.1 mercuric ion transport protein [Hephaestia caeni]